MIALAHSLPGRTRADRLEAHLVSCATILRGMNQERAWAERYRDCIWEGRAMLVWMTPGDDRRAQVEEQIRRLRDRVKVHMALVLIGRREIKRLNAEYCASRLALRLVAS